MRKVGESGARRGWWLRCRWVAATRTRLPVVLWGPARGTSRAGERLLTRPSAGPARGLRAQANQGTRPIASAFDIARFAAILRRQLSGSSLNG